MLCCEQEKIYDFIIIGGSSIGIEAGVVAKSQNQDILILEQGCSIGYNTKKYAHLDMFSPWYFNYSPLGIKTLQQHGKFQLPQHEYETTLEYLKNYLEPLAEVSKLPIRLNTKVLSIGKNQLAKTNLLGACR